jgi:hypothetical protein
MASDGLIRARPGVYGRQATPHERKILGDFACQYVADAPKRAAENSATLKRLTKKLLKQRELEKSNGFS